MRILLIEDDTKTSDYIAKGFSEAGHVCDVFGDGRDGLFQAQREAYDVIVVDRMLPGLDGLAIVRSLRAAKVGTSALFLTSIGGVDDPHSSRFLADASAFDVARLVAVVQGTAGNYWRPVRLKPLLPHHLTNR